MAYCNNLRQQGNSTQPVLLSVLSQSYDITRPFQTIYSSLDIAPKAFVLIQNKIIIIIIILFIKN